MLRKLHSPTSHGADGYCGIACLSFCLGYCWLTQFCQPVQSYRQSTSRETSILSVVETSPKDAIRLPERDHIQSRVTQLCDADAVFTPFGLDHGQLVAPHFAAPMALATLRLSDVLSARSLTDTQAKTFLPSPR